MKPTDTSALPFAFAPLWDAPRSVYAHYFPTFPISLDNKAPASDYYNVQFLNPAGEGGKWKAQGGFLRSRPIPVIPSTSTDPVAWRTANLQREIGLAISRGITGFCFDILSLADPVFGYMIAAASTLEPRFKIIPMFDVNSLGASLTQDAAVKVLTQIAAAPCAKRLRDGRVLFSAYNAPGKPLAFWAGVIAALNAANIAVAFLPVLVGGPNDAGTLNPIAWGVGAWGTATPGASAGINPTKAHAAGLKFMSPVDPQQSRPKSSNFWEASNLAALRQSWSASISTGCDLVQLITWNDYSEASQIAPVTDATFDTRIGTGIFDLTAYYATWFATGVQPSITQDVLYFCYRRAPSTVAHPNQANNVTCVTSGGGPEESSIEVVAFLTDTGTIMINGESLAVGPGISSFKIPSVAGVPKFALQRNGSNVFASDGPAQIYGPAGLPSGILDMTYLSGSITSAGITAYSNG